MHWIKWIKNSSASDLTSLLVGLTLFAALVILKTPNNIPVYHSPALVSDIKETAPLVIPQFLDKTIELGIHTEHRQRDEKISGLDQVSGAGACSIDYNSDGWNDLLILGGSGIGHYYGRPKWWQAGAGNALYRNIQGTRFEQQQNLLPDKLTWGLNCVSADLDMDGDEDLFIANKGKNQLIENLGGSFREVQTSNFQDQGLWTSQAVIADFDLDGLPDIYLVNYLEYSADIQYFEHSSGYMGAEEALFEPKLFRPIANQLLRNTGGLKFEDVTPDSGASDLSGRGASAQAIDLNSDELPDLIVSNDSGSPSKIFINSGSMQFQDLSTQYGVANSSSQRTMIAAQSLDTSGVELVIGGNRESPPSLLDLSDQGSRERVNIGDLSELVESTQAIAAADFNLDGIADYYLASGVLAPDMDEPSHSQAQRSRLLLGREDGSFLDCQQHDSTTTETKSTACFSDGLFPISSRNLIVEDFDNDGDLDIYESANNGLGRYLQNQLIQQEQNEPEHQLNLESPVVRLELSRWLLDDNKADIAMSELRLLSTNGSDDIAIAAISLLGSIANKAALEPLIAALRNQSELVREAAVLALRRQEVDYTGRYLIPLLSDSSERVRCAVAESFSHFFDEEEAMIRSKHLATSELANLAQDAEVPVCIIWALGKSERYRGLSPLVELAQHGSLDRRIAAIQALGVLKEQEAVAPLQDLAGQPSTPSSLLAHIENSLQLLNSSTENSPTQTSALAYQQENQRQSISPIFSAAFEECSELDFYRDNYSSATLLSEYREAQVVYEDASNPLRFCAARLLISVGPEEHIADLERELISGNHPPEQQIQIAAAIRDYGPARLWHRLLREEN